MPSKTNCLPQARMSLTFTAHFAKDEEAVITAATYPDQLLDCGCATMHGTDQKRRLIAKRAELAFDGSSRRPANKVRPTRPSSYLNRLPVLKQVP
jgi:hypothetical protein